MYNAWDECAHLQHCTQQDSTRQHSDAVAWARIYSKRLGTYQLNKQAGVTEKLGLQHHLKKKTAQKVG
jgi:hypothetical protein